MTRPLQGRDRWFESARAHRILRRAERRVVNPRRERRFESGSGASDASGTSVVRIRPSRSQQPADALLDPVGSQVTRRLELCLARRVHEIRPPRDRPVDALGVVDEAEDRRAVWHVVARTGERCLPVGVERDEPVDEPCAVLRSDPVVGQSGLDGGDVGTRLDERVEDAAGGEAVPRLVPERARRERRPGSSASTSRDGTAQAEQPSQGAWSKLRPGRSGNDPCSGSPRSRRTPSRPCPRPTRRGPRRRGRAPVDGRRDGRRAAAIRRRDRRRGAS